MYIYSTRYTITRHTKFCHPCLYITVRSQQTPVRNHTVIVNCHYQQCDYTLQLQADNVAYLVRRIMRCGIAPRIRSIIARCSRLSCVYANTTYHIHCRTQSSNRQVLTSVAHTKLQFLQFYYLFNINSLATCTNPTISNKLPLKTASANWTAFCINTHEPCQQLLFIRSRLPLKF